MDIDENGNVQQPSLLSVLDARSPSPIPTNVNEPHPPALAPFVQDNTSLQVADNSNPTASLPASPQAGTMASQEPLAGMSNERQPLHPKPKRMAAI